MEEDHQPEDLSMSPTEDPTSQIDNSAAQDSVQAQADHHQPEGPSNNPPVIITPLGYTRTGCQICRLADIAYVAYHCKTMALTGIKSVFDFHPFASL